MALLVLITAKAADVVSTFALIRSGGIEANPISLAAIDQLGLYAGLSVKAALAIALAVVVFKTISSVFGKSYLEVIGYLVMAAIFLLGTVQNIHIVLTGSDLFVVGVVG